MPVNDTNLVFYMAHYYSDPVSLRILKLSIQSIQYFYPLSDIVVCESPSMIKERQYHDISGVYHVINPIPNSGLVGCFKDYLQRYKISKKKGIFIHDSMILKARFNEEKLSRHFGFIWKFTRLYEPRYTELEELGKYLHKYLRDNDMNYEDYVGAFGYALYGVYESIDCIWNEVPFDLFMTYKERRKVRMDLERIIGAAAFKAKLVTSIDDCSLCGDIFDDAARFGRIYENETFEEIKNDPYNESVIKFWSHRVGIL